MSLSNEAQGAARETNSASQLNQPANQPTTKTAAATSTAASALLRQDGRRVDELRPAVLTRGWGNSGEGSVLVEFGQTRVLCVASFTEGVPRWKKGQGAGWVTAEYAMLPRAGSERSARESVRGKVGGRTHEISRLVGRSLRAVVDLQALGENTVLLDCDVLQADGGTRTAAITGAWVALHDAISWAVREKLVATSTVKKILLDSVAAISVGIIDGAPRLDLPYEEDVRAETDMNVVMTGNGGLVEVQGTAEHEPFTRSQLTELLDLAETGIRQLTDLQRRALAQEAGARLTLTAG